MAGSVVKQAPPFVVAEETFNGPFLLRDMDMNYRNIHVDEDDNITGITDWRYGQTVPMGHFTMIPALFIAPGSPEDVKAKDRAFIKRFLKALKSPEDKYQHPKATKTTNGKTAAPEKPGEVGTIALGCRIS
jgi:hypothetical protein